MPRPIKSPLKPTKFEDLDPRTQDFIKEKGLKKKSGGKKDLNNFSIKKTKNRFTKTDSPSTVEKAKEFKSPTERMNEKKAQTREQRLALTDIGMAKGGRAMYKSGMRVCKLAKRGKGRAYGKNS